MTLFDLEVKQKARRILYVMSFLIYDHTFTKCYISLTVTVATVQSITR